MTKDEYIEAERLLEKEYREKMAEKWEAVSGVGFSLILLGFGIVLGALIW